MSTAADTQLAAKVHAMSTHVLHQLARHRSSHPHPHPHTNAPPLFVAVQGPQGSGKTFLTARLHDALTAPPHALSLAVLSIDDLYLPHAGLAAVARDSPHNRLLQGRGLPGTHDVPLGSAILAALKRINSPSDNDNANGDGSGSGVVAIPSFDKSAFGGEGDRAPAEAGAEVRAPLDVVLLEGWCVGFYPASRAEIARRWDGPVPGLGDDFFGRRGFRKEDVFEVNERLEEMKGWWAFFDAFIQIKPVESHPYDYIYKWRLQQEHNMKAKNGGKGMTDEQVEKFVDRYIPGYVFFGDGIVEGGVDENGQRQSPPWTGNGLCIQIGEEREVVQVSHF